MEDDICVIHEACGEVFDDLKEAKNHLKTCKYGSGFDWTEWSLELREDAF